VQAPFTQCSWLPQQVAPQAKLASGHGSWHDPPRHVMPAQHSSVAAHAWFWLRQQAPSWQVPLLQHSLLLAHAIPGVPQH
jgi:hypothetical protein